MSKDRSEAACSSVPLDPLVGRWISVLEKEPPRDIPVLLANRFFVDYHHDAIPNRWVQSVHVAVIKESIRGSNITHWMPLPEPPNMPPNAEFSGARAAGDDNQGRRQASAATPG